MAKPPPSGPHSDIAGVNRDARAGAPDGDAENGGAAAKEGAQKDSKARPKDTGVDGTE
jgi:hypothetical protein